MPFIPKRTRLLLAPDVQEMLATLSNSRKESIHRVDRARILLAYAGGETVSSIARKLGTNRPRVERCIDKALELGPMAALADLPGRGRTPA